MERSYSTPQERLELKLKLNKMKDNLKIDIVECSLEEVSNAFRKVKIAMTHPDMDRTLPYQVYIGERIVCIQENKEHYIAPNKLEFILENGNIVLTSPVKLYIKEI